MNSLLPGFALGQNIVPAAEALEQPPNTHRMRWQRGVAVALFLLAPVILLAAALVDTVPGNCEICNRLGLGGLVSLHICLVCGVHYGRLNGQVPVKRGHLSVSQRRSCCEGNDLPFKARSMSKNCGTNCCGRRWSPRFGKELR